MGLEKHYFFTFLIIALFIRPFCTHSLNDVGSHVLEEEYGIDFRAYPSYARPIEAFTLDNSVFSDFNKSVRKLESSVMTVNVLSFGAKGDGKTDDSKAFAVAWEKACSSPNYVDFVVPRSRSFLLKPLRFSGPCKSKIKMEISGVILASDDRSDYAEDPRHWLIFDSVKDLVVEGGGTINGNGDIWWKNSCKINKAKALTFYKCTKLVVKNLKIQNAQQIHLSFEKCTNVQTSNLNVRAPEKSPNTDGIHVTGTRNIQISSCNIGTGDDCISIVSGSEKVRATDITCGPGHGISIGSLGSENSEEYVSDVVVNRAKLSGTTNGVRIKTWQGGSGSADNIKFQNIQMQGVKNPIIIDQSYCDQKEPCKEQSSAVQVKNILYKNIKGTSISDEAINFKCSKSHPCQGITLQNVNLIGTGGEKSKAVCNNVRLQNLGTVSPHCRN
ncbi:Polygalacturonase ADPG1 [Striga hermonthica]|uniref:endo-polygalacturonase n=1 Tax=Striga hermonthica TaxID=68872 RepID=A0A9N7NH28_STRHE|nr:Polygalacturonase ADPG1 [Striga hermonthica]